MSRVRIKDLPETPVFHTLGIKEDHVDGTVQGLQGLFLYIVLDKPRVIDEIEFPDLFWPCDPLTLHQTVVKLS